MRRGPGRRAGIGVLPWLAAGLGGLAPPGGAARGGGAERLLLYKESDGRTQVIDPLFFLHQDLGQSRGELDIIAGFDAISGASPTGGYPSLDVTTSASGRTSANGEFPVADYSDRRGSLSAAYRRRLGSHLPQVDLSYSKENDYTARGIGLSDAWTMLEGRGTLHLGLSASRDVVLPVGSSVDRPKDSTGVALGWTWVLGERDLLDVSGSLTRLSGYLDDPYKVVPIGSPDAGTTVPDQRPDSRQRFALVAKYGHYYSWEGAIKTSYRFYSDDWGVKAHTIEVNYDQHFGSDWIVSPTVRLYVQSGASFYGTLFVQPETFMSADYRLSAFNSVVGGLRVTKTLFKGFDLYAGITYQAQRGSDRIALTGSAPEVRDDEGDDEHDTRSTSVSAADLNVATVMIGFTRRF